MSRTPGLLPVSVSLSFNCIRFFPISAPDMSTSCSCKGGWSTELVKEVLNQSQISQQFQRYFSTSNFIFLVLNKDLFMGEACLLNMFVDHCVYLIWFWNILLVRSENTYIHNRLRWHISITLVLSISKKDCLTDQKDRTRGKCCPCKVLSFIMC